MDHKALEYFATKRELTSRQINWAQQIAEYDMKLTYCAGSANIVADALSRKQDELKSQREKDVVARTQSLLGPT